jgi:hypothetical protein
MNEQYQPYDPSSLPDPQQASLQDLVTVHVIQIEALMRLGQAKGLWTRAEALAVINGVAEDFKANRRNGRN